MGRLVLSLFHPSSCLPGRLEPGVLRPYLHVLQRGGRRAPTHHTVTSCLHFITGGLMSWKSRRQDNTFLSTFEAEFVVATQAGQEAIYLRETLTDLGFPLAN